MKTAEELFEKYAIKYVTHDNPNDFIETTSFLATEKFFFMKALTEYKQSILALVDEIYNKTLEEKRNNYDHTEFYVGGFLDGKLTLLSELKQKIGDL